MTFCNVLRSGTLSSAARECHSLNWEWRRSATPFYHKEQCGSGTPFFRAGAALFSPSFFFSFFSWRSYFLLERMGEISSTKRLARRNFEIGLLLKFIYSEEATNVCEISTVDLSYVTSNLRWRFRKILWPHNKWALKMNSMGVLAKN